MEKEKKNLRLLLVDDEEDFRRATSQGLTRRGFIVAEATSGEEALKAIIHELPDIIILDQKMPGLSGIETLHQIREINTDLPVIILTGHGDFQTALSGIKLGIIDFMQKPVDIEVLSERIWSLMKAEPEKPLRELSISELMAPASLYPKVYIDDAMNKILKAITDAYRKPIPENSRWGQVRSALVYDRNEKFLGIIRFSDLLRLIIPSFLSDSPYASYFTGMFLAQSKIFGGLNISSLVTKQVFVDLDAPIMEAIHLLVENRLINIPVVNDGKLVGILRGRDIIIETARLAGVLY